MSRKMIITLALSLVLVMIVGVAVYAQGPGPVNTQAAGGGQQMLQIHDGSGDCDAFVDEDGDGVCDNALLDGMGGQAGTMTRQNARMNTQANTQGIGQQARRGGQAMNQNQTAGQGMGDNFVDADGDGVCDSFVDADGDGINDIAPQDGTGSQFGKSRGTRGQGRNR